jgi:sugar phosphate permease
MATEKRKAGSEFKAWVVWSFAGLFYCYQFILRNSPGVMTQDLMKDFSIEACALGVLTTFYLISYTALQIPIGVGMDKFGPTRLLRIAVPLCVVGTAFFGLSESFYLACFGRLLIGAGSACAFLGALKLATLWFHPEKLALVVGFTLLAGKVGAALGKSPVALLVETLGWREAILYVILPLGCILSACIWFFVSDTPPSGPLTTIEPIDTRLKTLFERLYKIMLDYRIWALGFYGALMYVPMLAFADLWGDPFLMELYDIDKVTAASVTTMFYFGVGIGSPVVALLSDYFRARKIPMAIGAALAILCNVIIIYVPAIPLSTMYALLFSAGFIFSAQPLIFASVCQLTPLSSNGTAVSFTNMIVMMLGLVTQPLIGHFLDWSWSGIMQNGVPFYTVSDYRFALLCIPIGLLLALVMMPLIPETFPRSQEKN